MVSDSRREPASWLDCMSALPGLERVSFSVPGQVIHASFTAQDLRFVVRVAALTYLPGVSPIVSCSSMSTSLTGSLWSRCCTMVDSSVWLTSGLSSSYWSVWIKVWIHWYDTVSHCICFKQVSYSFGYSLGFITGQVSVAITYCGHVSWVVPTFAVSKWPYQFPSC